MNYRIIRSLLDTDFYKFTMGQFVFRHYPRTQVKYSFKNRTKDVKLAKLISLRDIQHQLDTARELKFANDEIEYLRDLDIGGRAIFNEEYLRFLNTFQLPPYRLDQLDGDLILEFAGPWHQTIYWETIALSIVNEMYNQVNFSILTGLKERLNVKIDFLKKHPDIKFADFGTRRRSSHAWHASVIHDIASMLPNNFIGTSNVFFSKVYNRQPIGTFAHELLMIPTALVIKDIGPDIYGVARTNQDILAEWSAMYGKELCIALSDTYGSDFFYDRIFDVANANFYKGVRQDSGDPFKFADKTINFYLSKGIDPKEKTIVFSDGLETFMMDQLTAHCKDRINVRFGWGTNLTNDSYVRPLSIVVKPIEADGEDCVKLSDNLAKANGHPSAVEGYKKMLGYENGFYEYCKY